MTTILLIYIIHDPYTLPSCVFSNSKLANLSISNCIIKMTKETFTAFSRLQSLSLSYLTLNPCVLITPLLTSLSIIHCSGIQCFSISAPVLVSLTLNNYDLNFIPYLICTNIISVCIYDPHMHKYVGEVGGVNFMKLLPCWPKMVQLELNGSSLMSLATGLVPESFSLVVSLTRLTLDWIRRDDLVWVQSNAFYETLLSCKYLKLCSGYPVLKRSTWTWRDQALGIGWNNFIR